MTSLHPDAVDIDSSTVDIGSFPTPVETAPTFGAELGVPNLSLKREDLAGESYGGNKVRKLRYLLGAAIDEGCSRVFTSGAVGSNHVLATVTHARGVELVPEALQFPQEPTPHVRQNLQALAAQSPTLRLVGSKYRFPPALAAKRVRLARDEDCFAIPTGGSSPLGTVGYVEAATELAMQVEAGEIPEPDVIVVPASSGGTLAGLRVGLDLTSLSSQLVGVRVAPWFAVNRLTVARLANKTAALCGLSGQRYRRADITLCGEYIGSGYAEPTPAGERVQAVAAEYGLTLDPTYTAKTVAAIAGEFDDERVLYWHTLSSTRPEGCSVAKARERLPDGYERFLEG